MGPARAGSPLLVSVILSVAVSACIAGGDAAFPAQGPGAVGFDEDTGSIVGSVVNLELSPVANARVTVLNTTIEAFTDEAGAFNLPFVPPGSQRVRVDALGFQSAERTVDVYVGAATEQVVFTLVELGRIVPYHTTTIHKILMTNGFAVTAPRDCIYVTASVKTCQATYGDCEPSECEVHYGHCGDGGSYAKWGCDFGVGWKTLIAEVESQSTSAVTGRGWSFTVLGPNVSRSGGDSGAADNGEARAWRTVSHPPIYTWVDEAALVERNIDPKDWCGGIDIEPGRCDWVWRIFPGPCELGCDFVGPNVGIMIEQRATIYFTYFMYEGAPSEWSARPDA